MRPTQVRLGGGAPQPKTGHWLGDWGSFGEFGLLDERLQRITRKRDFEDARRRMVGSGAKQKGIVDYGLSANRQNPFAGAAHDAIFNTFRRTKSQIFYWLPPMLAGYYLLSWATERNHYLNSKAGRAEFADSE
ncbi:uncharacterized protein Triagg1_762 [Trichoderma aggressivum f. europaeum]|uniref:Cytochrome b-c1 complex subunit 8 n=1 Tax=Trichoderma aggressivum f. europaeum TaxID=173218 RepID=A0AAE1IK41_9HYPO|nr:hypothetical protein Triagg1_762 [Trichoderma aggressivum f. europaeum]